MQIPVKQVPKTIENTREVDDNIYKIDDEEVCQGI